MPIYEYDGRLPRVDPTAWIAPGAEVIGDVRIGPECYIGFGVILRGDYGTIDIGPGCAVEEGVIVHARPQGVAVFGKEVTIGHGAMIHNAQIEDYAVIGMCAVISDYAKVGRWAIIGEMGLVKSKQQVPSEVIAIGRPVQIQGPVEPRHKTMWTFGKKVYRELARTNAQKLKRVAP